MRLQSWPAGDVQSRHFQQDEAAAKAKEIYAMLVGAWMGCCARQVQAGDGEKGFATVGAFLEELRGHWAGKPKTFEDYSQKFLHDAGGDFRHRVGDASRFDHIDGGREKWIARLDAIRLDRVTPARVKRWKHRFREKGWQQSDFAAAGAYLLQFHHAPSEEPLRAGDAENAGRGQTGNDAIRRGEILPPRIHALPEHRGHRGPD